MNITKGSAGIQLFSSSFYSYLTTHFSVKCRGEKLLDDKVAARLKCRYTTGRHPFLKIQPVKVEEAALKPYIVVYHEVISDDEIETVKKLAQPRVTNTASIYNPI